MDIGYQTYREGYVESLADRCHREHVHLAAYDYMRTMACLLIFLSHVTVFSGHTLSTLLWNMTGSSASILFFIISGCFLLPIRPGGITEFFRKRLVRLIAPFVIYITAFIVIRYLMGDITHAEMTGKLKWMWLMGGNRVSWFMLVLISAYLFMPFISPWLWHATRRQVEAYLLIWLAASLLPFIEPYSQHLQWSTPDQAGSWLRLFYNYFGFFILGYYLVRWPFAEWSRRRKVAVVTFCILAIVVVYPLYFYKYPDNVDMRGLPNYWYAIPAMSKFILLYILMIGIRKNTGWIYACVRYVSRYSYAIYLCHPIYVWVVLPATLYPLIPVWSRFPVALAVTLLTVTALSKLPLIGKYMR